MKAYRSAAQLVVPLGLEKVVTKADLKVVRLAGDWVELLVYYLAWRLAAS